MVLYVFLCLPKPGYSFLCGAALDLFPPGVLIKTKQKMRIIYYETYNFLSIEMFCVPLTVLHKRDCATRLGRNTL